MDLKQKLNAFPEKPGIYLFKNKKGKVIYIGKSVNLKKRVKSYYGKKDNLGAKTRLLVLLTADIDHILVDSEIEALLLEAKLIKKYQPRFNSQAKDDKHDLYIRITNQELPRVLLARRKQQKKGDLFYGPFPSSRTVRKVLKILRKIFPFCTCKNPQRPCLYFHLGLCFPSPPVIENLPKKDAEKMKKIYQQNIKHLVSFLENKKKEVIEQLVDRMEKKAEKQKFEEAAKLRDQVQALEYISQDFRLPASYLKNPNLIADQRQQEIDKLFKLLKKAGVKLKNKPHRIEGYDVSNIKGKKASGSMVTFIGGFAEKNLYRRFKIKAEGTGDTAMIGEVIKRRLTHPEWSWPDLILVDGGKGQVSSAARIITKKSLKIPVIGLAKQDERIIIVVRNKFITRKPEAGSPALQLLQRIRDEAHRFAISYHKTLRKKDFLPE